MPAIHLSNEQIDLVIEALAQWRAETFHAIAKANRQPTTSEAFNLGLATGTMNKLTLEHAAKKTG